jgi:ABC-type glycerol-3-phosphate transport system substrate-binding protein
MSRSPACRIGRRFFLRSIGLVAGVGAAAPILAACSTPPPAPTAETKIVERVVTQVVEREKVVEKPVEKVVERVVTVIPTAAPVTSQGTVPDPVTMWWQVFAPHQQMMTIALNAWDKKNNSQQKLIDYQPQPGNYGAKWRAALAANQAPDLMSMHGTALLESALAKAIAPLTPDVFTIPELKREFMPENYLQSFYQGNVYALGVPDPPGDAGLVVNLDQLQEAKLPFLTAFESRAQLLEYGRKLVVRERDQVLRAGLMITGDGNNPIYWLSYIADQGGRFFDNEKQRFTLRTPEAEAALQFFADIVLKERLDDPGLGNNSSNALGQGTAAMAFKWPEFPGFARLNFPGMNFGFSIKPGFVPGKAPVFNHTDTHNVVMWAGTKKKDRAVAFLQFLKTREIQRQMLTANPGMSPRKDITFDPKESFWTTGPGAYMMPVLDAITRGQYRFFGPFGNMDTLEYDTMWPVMDSVFQKKADVKTALQTMEEKLNDEMKKYLDKYPELKTTIHWDGLPADLMEGIPMKSGA